jgi:biotin transport system substrate-specific component
MRITLQSARRFNRKIIHRKWKTIMHSNLALVKNWFGHRSLTRDVVLVALGSLLLAISAKVQVPFWPVPMTMQTFVVLMIGAHAGFRLAGATVLLYLVEGAIGLPVFSTGAGLAFMAGPTGGYLLGFLVSAVVVSGLFAKGFNRSLPTAFGVLVLGDALILGIGFAWLSTLIGAEKALAVGVLPFIPAEALKIALATASLFVTRMRKVDTETL